MCRMSELPTLPDSAEKFLLKIYRSFHVQMDKFEKGGGEIPKYDMPDSGVHAQKPGISASNVDTLALASGHSRAANISIPPIRDILDNNHNREQVSTIREIFQICPSEHEKIGIFSGGIFLQNQGELAALTFYTPYNYSPWIEIPTGPLAKLSSF